MNIKNILNEITNESSTNKKMEILKTYKDNDILKKVLYLAVSKRIKFYIKQIPEYKAGLNTSYTLEEAVEDLKVLYNREETGHGAIEFLKATLENLSTSDAEILEKIIKKDLKIGMGSTNINKVIPNLIEKTPYMGAKSFSEKLARNIFSKSKKAYSQLKLDGRYCNVIVRDGEVEMESREGENNSLIGSVLEQELSKIDSNVVLTGELLVEGVKARKTANGIIASVIDIISKKDIRTIDETNKHIEKFLKKHSSDVENKEHTTFDEYLNRIRLVCWDVITVDEYFNKCSNVPYSTRLKNLENLLSNIDSNIVSIVYSKEVDTYEEAMNHFQEALKNGEEGTILKACDNLWKDGKPVTQIKMKLEIDLDLKIVGFKYGTEGTKNENWISVLHLESSCGLLKTSPGGMKEDMMKYVTENQEELLGKIVEIRCCGLSQDIDNNYSTMHPSIVEFRLDKDTYDSLESAIDIENGVKGLQ